VLELSGDASPSAQALEMAGADVDCAVCAELSGAASPMLVIELQAMDVNNVASSAACAGDAQEALVVGAPAGALVVPDLAAAPAVADEPKKPRAHKMPAEQVQEWHKLFERESASWGEVMPKGAASSVGELQVAQTKRVGWEAPNRDQLTRCLKLWKAKSMPALTADVPERRVLELNGAEAPALAMEKLARAEGDSAACAEQSGAAPPTQAMEVAVAEVDSAMCAEQSGAVAMKGTGKGMYQRKRSALQIRKSARYAWTVQNARRLASQGGAPADAASAECDLELMQQPPPKGVRKSKRPRKSGAAPFSTPLTRRGTSATMPLSAALTREANAQLECLRLTEELRFARMSASSKSYDNKRLRNLISLAGGAADGEPGPAVGSDGFQLEAGMWQLVAAAEDRTAAKAEREAAVVALTAARATLESSQADLAAARGVGGGAGRPRGGAQGARRGAG